MNARMKLLMIVCSLVLTVLSPVTSAAHSQVPRPGNDSLAALSPEERAAHEELIAFRVGVQDAFNKMGESGKPEDMVALLEYADPDILFTPMTGESFRGRAALLAYFKREFINEGHSLKRMHSEFTADHLSIFLRPDVATNRGTARGTFVFANNSELTVNTRWTATLVKRDGRWKLAAFQFSPSIFDNPVVDAYRKWIYKAAIGAGVAALSIGILVGRWTRRPRHA